MDRSAFVLFTELLLKIRDQPVPSIFKAETELIKLHVPEAKRYGLFLSVDFYEIPLPWWNQLGNKGKALTGKALKNFIAIF